MSDPTAFVTSKRGAVPGTFTMVYSPLGTGIVDRSTVFPKLNGVNGSFPFGYEVVPDRPRTWDV
jgi:hypothetical protein